MHSSSLVSLITADALRAAIRALGTLRDVRGSGLSLPRALRAQNSSSSLRQELCRLRGLGDLLVPVCTTRENSVRAERQSPLFALLPPDPPLLRLAESFSGPLPGPLRGHLIAADEMAIRAVEAKVARQFGGAQSPEARSDESAAGPANRALDLLNEESASWRMLEASRLANRLIADHGFADTYGQARKRARSLIKEQAAAANGELKTRDIKALQRWHDSVEAQLGTLAGAGTASPELQELQGRLRVLRDLQCRWLGLARLRRVPGLAEFDGQALCTACVEIQERLVADMMGSLQQCYGASKSNFRGLIESELA